MHSTASAGVQPGVAMQCRTPSVSAKERSNLPIMSEVRPLSTTSFRYFSQFGPMVLGKAFGSSPISR